jgi:hypothetical protein
MNKTISRALRAIESAQAVQPMEKSVWVDVTMCRLLIAEYAERSARLGGQFASAQLKRYAVRVERSIGGAA